MNIWAGYRFFMITLLAGQQSISPELYEAARVEGADYVQRLRKGRRHNWLGRLATARLGRVLRPLGGAFGGPKPSRRGSSSSHLDRIRSSPARPYTREPRRPTTIAAPGVMAVAGEMKPWWIRAVGAPWLAQWPVGAAGPAAPAPNTSRRSRGQEVPRGSRPGSRLTCRVPGSSTSSGPTTRSPRPHHRRHRLCDPARGDLGRHLRLRGLTRSCRPSTPILITRSHDALPCLGFFPTPSGSRPAHHDRERPRRSAP